MSLIKMIPLDKDGNPIKKKKKPEPRLEMETWKDYHPPRLKISDPIVSPTPAPRELPLATDKHIDPAPMDRGQTSPSDLKIRRETDPAAITVDGKNDIQDLPNQARYGSTQGNIRVPDVFNRFGVPDAPQVTTPPNSMFMRSQNAAGVRMKRSKAARSGRSSKGTKQFNRMMSINSLNV